MMKISFVMVAVVIFFSGLSSAETENNCECSRRPIKEWSVPVGGTTEIRLGSFKLVVDNTAGPRIVFGRGILRYPIPGSDGEQFIEIPAGDANASRRIPFWLGEKSQGFKIDFFRSPKGGGVILRAERFQK